MIIYKITNLINNKVYIGQTNQPNPMIRIKYHFKKKNYKSIIYDAIQKYGKDNFKIEYICSCLDQETLNQMEIYFINYFNSLIPHGYNVKKGGEQGGKLLEETKKYIGQQIKAWYAKHEHPLKNKKFSPEHIKALSISRKGFDSPARKLAREKSHEKMRIKIKSINLKTNEIQIFNSIVECGKILNLLPECISKVLNNKENRKQHKGYKFEKI